MIAELEIKKQVVRFLANEIDLDSFEDWLAEKSWNMHLDSDGAAQKLASSIELRLSEHSSGHLSEENLRKELTPLATHFEINFTDAPKIIMSTSNAMVLTVPRLSFQVVPSSAGISPVVEFV